MIPFSTQWGWFSSYLHPNYIEIGQVSCKNQNFISRINSLDLIGQKDGNITLQIWFSDPQAYQQFYVSFYGHPPQKQNTNLLIEKDTAARKEMISLLKNKYSLLYDDLQLDKMMEATTWDEVILPSAKRCYRDLLRYKKGKIDPAWDENLNDYELFSLLNREISHYEKKISYPPEMPPLPPVLLSEKRKQLQELQEKIRLDDPNRSDTNGELPLHVHIEDLESVKTLLKQGANPLFRNGKGENPFFKAKSIAVFEALFAAAILPAQEILNQRSRKVTTILYSYLKTSDPDPAVLEYLCKQGADINATNGRLKQTALYRAAKRRKISDTLLKKLVSLGGNLKTDSSAFIVACEKNLKKRALFLIQQGILIDRECRQEISWLNPIYPIDQQIGKIFFQRENRDILLKEINWTPLHFAAALDLHHEIPPLLATATPESKTESLQLAFERGAILSTYLFLKAGISCEPQFKDHPNYRPLNDLIAIFKRSPKGRYTRLRQFINTMQNFIRERQRIEIHQDIHSYQWNSLKQLEKMI